jgi:hypothetical protein
MQLGFRGFSQVLVMAAQHYHMISQDLVMQLVSYNAKYGDRLHLIRLFEDLNAS